MLLATDLDGTFLGGSAEDRQTLYQLVSGSQDIQLVFVTGRGLEAVMPLLSDPLVPTPDYIICDVGGTVVEGASLQPVQPLQADIDRRWPGELAVAAAVAAFPELERQEVPQQRRCSYFCHQDAVTPALVEAARALGCEVMYSASRYLDLLPAGVNKGSTLQALVDQLGIAHDEVLVAGDTLNDLAMFEAGFQGVCVGDSEAALLAATGDLANVFHAGAAGCGGAAPGPELLHSPHCSLQPAGAAGHGGAAACGAGAVVFPPLPAGRWLRGQAHRVCGSGYYYLRAGHGGCNCCGPAGGGVFRCCDLPLRNLHIVFGQGWWLHTR